MSEATAPLQQRVESLKVQEKSDLAFNGVKIRTEKAKRIKDDIRPTDGRPYSRERVQEIRDIEMRSTQGSKEGELSEEVMDARGFQEVRFTLHHLSPDGKTVIPETIVAFAKLTEDSQVQYLTDQNGRPIAFNSDMYDARLRSYKHAIGTGYDMYTIAKVDGRGAYTGIVSLQLDKTVDSPASTITTDQEPTEATSGQSREAMSTKTLNPEQLREKLQPVLDKLNINPDQLTRLGIEVPLTLDDVQQIKDFIQQRITLLNNESVLQDIQKLIQQYGGKNAAFDAAMAFGTAIKEDSSLAQTKVIQTNSGPVIMVPTEAYQQWRAWSDLQTAKTVVEGYNTQDPKLSKGRAYGILSKKLASMLVTGT